ncbi:uncharacterized protein LOC107814085 isoform X2 [Nicotiana tabacum]|uniref:Uncharacterized protein LOC107814085 isoform X2 n=6 Tax=Nicotiana TaxID=4085 RepID=A0AC58UPZ9_TOBAC|nr:PREDICTED: uncharacterized protein LOC104247563 [Nicotiana sylvestris]
MDPLRGIWLQKDRTSVWKICQRFDKGEQSKADAEKSRCGLLRCSPFLELLVVLYPVARPGITALPPIFGAVGRTGIMSTSESFASAAGRSVVADVKSAGVIGAASGLAKIVYSKYEPAAKGLYTKYEPMSNMQHQLGSL